MMHLWVQTPSPAGASTSEREARGELTINSAPHHPFSQERFLASLVSSPECVSELRRIVSVLLGNTLRPLLFSESDEAALRNSEIHLLGEMLARRELFQALLEKEREPEEEEEEDDEEDEEDEEEAEKEEEEAAANAHAGPAAPALPPLPAVTPGSLLHTLLRALSLARADGSAQAERVFQYRSFLSDLSGPIRASEKVLAAVRQAVDPAAKQQQEDEQARATIAEAKQDAETWAIVTRWTQA
jgi:hypothetical protein